MVFEKKSSARVAEAGQRRVLDDATRQRRLNRQLDALEKDNFQDDPLSSLPPSGPTARLPAFSEGEEPGKKKRKTRGDHFKQRFRKNFQTLLEEEVSEDDSVAADLTIPGHAHKMWMVNSSTCSCIECYNTGTALRIMTVYQRCYGENTTREVMGNATRKLQTCTQWLSTLRCDVSVVE
ncbi:zinc finger HIT domain-containing protein 1-like isoform X1 [Oncorhynchus masou masou]|uniref:Uncharacterized protein n=1 Tax=Oncorhynchus mykiss TaxID=8022 RepID=A0A8K9UTJ1_ONCMY